MTMGMVFVASMFPVGLHNARKTAEATIQMIESHNAAVAAELNIGDIRLSHHQKMVSTAAIASYSYIDTTPSVVNDAIYEYINKYTFNRNNMLPGFYNTVHFLARPNIFYNDYNSGVKRVILADFEYEYDSSSYWNHFHTTYLYADSSLFTASNDAEILSSMPCPLTTFDEPYGPFYLSNISNYVISDKTIWYPETTVAVHDIGKIMCPVIDETSEGVLEQVNRLAGGSYDLTSVAARQNLLYPAIYDVAMEQKFNWAVFYQEDGNGNLPKSLIIFILKQGVGSNSRYAVQTPVSMVLDTPADPYYNYVTGTKGGCIGMSTATAMLGANYDCVFPVPWRVYLPNPIVDDLATAASGDVASFTVGQNIAQLLREGSVLIDADPEGGIWNAANQLRNTAGKIFRVKEVQLADPVAQTYNIVLNTSIGDAGKPNSLFSFWVFPPPVIRDASGAFVDFGDNQPVVDIIVKPFEFDKR